MLYHDGPYVLDVVVPYTEHVMRMIPAGKTVKDMILKQTPPSRPTRRMR